MMRLYIVTGANGHLGGTIVRMLQKKGAPVRPFFAGIYKFVRRVIYRRSGGSSGESPTDVSAADGTTESPVCFVRSADDADRLYPVMLQDSDMPGGEPFSRYRAGDCGRA